MTIEFDNDDLVVIFTATVIVVGITCLTQCTRETQDLEYKAHHPTPTNQVTQ